MSVLRPQSFYKYIRRKKEEGRREGEKRKREKMVKEGSEEAKKSTLC